MLRTILTLLIATVVLVGPAAPSAVARSDALTGARKTILKDFKRQAKEAEKVLANVAAARASDLRKGDIDAAAAASGFGGAVGFFANTLKRLADEAGDAFLEAADQEFGDSGDPELRGSQAGDGGSYDALADALQSEFDKYRGRSRKRAQRFAAVVAKDGGVRVKMHSVFEPWIFERRSIPSIDGARRPGEAAPRLWGLFATTGDDGRTVLTAYGSADPTQDGRFDVRVEFSIQRPIGDLLSEGGMRVSLNGTWSDTVEFVVGQSERDNRAVLFGVEPFDGGLAGQQPGRLVHAGVISIP